MGVLVSVACSLMLAYRMPPVAYRRTIGSGIGRPRSTLTKPAGPAGAIGVGADSRLRAVLQVLAIDVQPDRASRRTHIEADAEVVSHGGEVVLVLTRRKCGTAEHANGER